MPTPIDVLMDPVSLWLLAIYAMLMLTEALFPARQLPKIKGWLPRAFVSFVVYFYLSTYLPLIWDKYLIEYQLFNLESMNNIASTVIALLVFEFLIYVWHRAMHEKKWLWRAFHQMHHSSERLDTYGAFYFSPLDMIGFTMVGSLSLSLIVGISPEAVSYFLYITMFLGIFQHTNIRTPQWLGYLVQRPESHSVHHGKGVHRYNYSDLPVFDIVFGTFKNPKGFTQEAGYYPGASARVPEMLLFKDVSEKPESLIEAKAS